MVHGAGPATVLRAVGAEAALVFQDCSEIAVRTLRVEGGTAATVATGEHLNGAITFIGGGEVSVSDCFLSCPDAQADSHGHVRATQTCLTARGGAAPLRVRLERNRFEVGVLQTGVLLVDPAHAYVAGNGVRVAGVRDLTTGRLADEGIVVGGGSVGTIEILDNIVEQTIQGIHVAASGPAAGREAAEAVLLSRNVVHARVPAAHRRGRHAIFVGNARTVHVKDTIATLERTGGGRRRRSTRSASTGSSVRSSPSARRACATSGSASGWSRSSRSRARACGSSPRRWRTAHRSARRCRSRSTTSGTTPSGTPSRPSPSRRCPRRGPRARRTRHRHRARRSRARPIAGVDVFFAVLGPPNMRPPQAVETDASGVARFSVHGRQRGPRHDSAFADSNGNGRQDADEPATLAAADFVSATPANWRSRRAPTRACAAPRLP